MTKADQVKTELRFLSGVPWTEIHRAMQASFADYAIDMSYMTERFLELRSRKNGVDLAVSPGLFAGGELVGFTLVGLGSRRGEPAAFDSATGLVRAWRGQGWASALFAHARPALRMRGVKRFVLEVLQENQAAIRAYEKSGFRIVRELDCFDLRPLGPAVAPSPLAGITIARTGFEVLPTFERSAEWPLSWECSFDAQRRSGSDVAIWAARSGGDPVGMVAFHTGLSWLMACQVRPAWRRRGVASALLRGVLAEYSGPGGRVRADNIQRDDGATQSLLLRHGFRKVASQYEMESRLS